jgi:hypothetical protein
MNAAQADDLVAVIGIATQMFFLANEPFPVTSESLVAATVEADRLGQEVTRRVGDTAYRSLNPG